MAAAALLYVAEWLIHAGIVRSGACDTMAIAVCFADVWSEPKVLCGDVLLETPKR